MRFVTVIPNFSPIVGLTIFGAALFSRKYLAIIVHFLCIYFSDLIINNTISRPFFPEASGFIWFSEYMIWNFIAYGSIALLAMVALKKLTFKRGISVTLISSVIFFLTTNFGSMINSMGLYPRDFSGLMMSYTAALPFFRTSLISDLVFSGALFGIYFLSVKVLNPKFTTA
jgi:hypothetical protein